MIFSNPSVIKSYSYHLLDVFTSVPFGGNPMAVFTDGSGLSDSQMQKIARELNLSETTFVLPARDSSHDYRVRIFTPAAELMSGGQPTIGTAFALSLEQRQKSQRLVFEEGNGPVSVQMHAPMLMMQQPLPEMGPLFEDRAAIAAMLGLELDRLSPRLPVQSVSCGVPYLIVPVRDLEAMSRIRLRTDIWERVLRRSSHPHLLPFTLNSVSAGATAHCRMFAPLLGLYEDPATATAAGPLAAYLVQHGLADNTPRPTFVFEQGVQIGRPSFVHVSLEHERGRFSWIRVGGQCVVVGQGQIHVQGEL